MEEALIEMKKRNDELVRGNKDAIDGPTSPKFYTTNDQVLHLQEQLKRREAAHTERIVEMVRIQFVLMCWAFFFLFSVYIQFLIPPPFAPFTNLFHSHLRKQATKNWSLFFLANSR